MRILIVLPLQERATGNEVTAARHCAGLVARGHQVALERVTLKDGSRLSMTVAAFNPDIVHLLHAYRSGLPWLEAGLDRTPWVVTLTGTDIHGGIDDSREGPVIRSIMARASKIIVHNHLTAGLLENLFPPLAGKVTWIRPGVMLGNAPSPFTRSELAAPGDTLFLHPAGLRPVKGNLELLHLFAPLAEIGLPFSVAFCGPPLDPTYSAAFQSAITRYPWASYLGTIPPEAMAATTALADVVVNNSTSEGLPNALLEAACLGVPMLVSNIPGNCAIVEEQVNGLIYDNADSFARKARALVEDSTLRHRLALPQAELYTPEQETAALLTTYREVLTT
jgi:glycosyltransferase involved in cell wall biosynthesis